jgi:hypothetical protein
MKIKLLVVFFSALLLEVGSTFYINGVAEKNVSQILVWAFLGPFIALPFAGVIADEKTWGRRIFIACSSAIGYSLGALITTLVLIS